MQNGKIVVNIVVWFQNYGKMTDDYIYSDDCRLQ